MSRVNLGCGGRPRPGYVNVDIREVEGVDILADVRDVTLRDCTVRWAPNPSANYGPALRTERVTELRNEGFRGGTAAPRP